MLLLVSVVALAVVVLVTMAPARSRAPSFTPAAQYRRGGVGIEHRSPAPSGAGSPDGRGVAVERLGPIPTIGAWVALSSLGWYLLFLVFVAR